MAAMSEIHGHMAPTVQEALQWFRSVFVKTFVNETISKQHLSRKAEDDPEFPSQLFNLFDSDNSGTISFQEFTGGVLRLDRGAEMAQEEFTNLTRTFITMAGTDGLMDEGSFSHLCREIKFTDVLFELCDLDNSGDIRPTEFLIAIDKLARSNTDIKWYTWAEKWFSQHASEDGRIDKDQFLEYLNVQVRKTPNNLSIYLSWKSPTTFADYCLRDMTLVCGGLYSLGPLIAAHTAFRERSNSSWPTGHLRTDPGEFESPFGERLFEIVDSDNSGSVDVTELMRIIHVLTYGTQKQRLLMLFELYDINGDGRLNRMEIETVLEWCLSDSSLQNKQDLVGRLTDTLFEKMDLDNSGDICIAEFEVFLNQYPQIANNITISLPQCLRPVNKENSGFCIRVNRRLDRAFCFLMNNLPLVGFWILFWIINTVFFVTSAMNYWSDHSIFMGLARGSGRCLCFNSVLMLVFMYRRVLRYLRSTRFRKYLPIDHAVSTHRVVGFIVVVFSLFHGAMHVANGDVIHRRLNVTLPEYLFSVKNGPGWVEDLACLTGWMLEVVLAIIVVTSLARVRKSVCFQVFYWSHWIFLVWYAVLVVHAKDFWKWMVGPFVIYLLDKLWGPIFGHGVISTAVLSIRSVNDKVSEVILERPRSFKFNAGEYINILLPSIAKFEWHPFTISSAPEEPDFISIHVQAVGDWTKELRELGKSWTRHLNNSIELYNSSGDKNANKYIPDYNHKEQAHTSYGFVNTAFDDDLSHSSETQSTPRQSNQVLPSARLSTRIYSTGTNVFENSSRDVGQGSPPQGFSLSAGSRSITGITARPRIASNIDYARDENDTTLPPDSISNFKLQALIDGPYGSPTVSVYDVDHAILIGAGIGITPFSSILKSIVSRQKRLRAICPNCNYYWKTTDTMVKVPKKVNFIWVTATFDTMEWLLEVVNDAEEEQDLLELDERFLDISLYMTRALVESDIRAVALQMALDQCHKEDSRDLLSGLRTRIRPGRPNWRRVLQSITLNQVQGRRSVFYCGPPRLENTLRKVTSDLTLDFRSELF